MLKEQLAMALDSLRANRFRALLTMLGIIIGSSTLVAVLSLGNALQSSVFEQFIDLGTRRVAVLPGDPQANGAREVPGYGLIATRDYRALEQLVAAQPELFRALAAEATTRTEVRAGTTAVETSLVGTTADYARIQTVPMLHGRFLSEADEQEAARVGVLGYLVAQDLFGESPEALAAALGQTVEVNGQPIIVVGVVDENGGPFSTDGRVFAPLSTVRLRLIGDLDLPGRGVELSSILVGITSEQLVDQAERSLTSALRAAREVPEGAIDDFELELPTQALGVLAGINGAITGFIALVGGISLLVGGIGIMNIMLVAVTERTREIGVRKALGARDSDILGQFVLEAMAVSLAGGLIGVVLAILLVLLISALAGLGASIAWPAVVIALVFAALVGVGFGIYPAQRAARLLPIEALRYE
jgi:putative ABC transport system permease protein